MLREDVGVGGLAMLREDVGVGRLAMLREDVGVRFLRTMVGKHRTGQVWPDPTNNPRVRTRARDGNLIKDRNEMGFLGVTSNSMQ